MTKSSSGNFERHVKQVNGVGFSLDGKVSKRERARIETAVEQYIRANYGAIQAQFAEEAAAVRLCINRTSNEVSIAPAGPCGALGLAEASSGKPIGRSVAMTKRAKLDSRQLDLDTRSTTSAPVVASQQQQQRRKQQQHQQQQEQLEIGTTDGESMEAAIEYLMSNDRRSLGVIGGGGGFVGSGGGEKRMLKSGIPRLVVSSANNTTGLVARPPAVATAAAAAASRLAMCGRAEKKQSRQQKKRLTATEETSVSVAESAAAILAVKKSLLVGDSYDVRSRGASFRRLFPSVRGEFFVFYDHGETHCRKTLTALGFRERPEEEERNIMRSIDQMAIQWCNGSISSAKRKSNLGFHIVNRLRYRGLVTNKCSLVRTMAEFELNHPHLVPKGLEASSFLPATIHMNGATAIDIFHKIRRGGMFLIKPGYSDCGKGIVLHRSDGSLASLISTLESSYPNYPHKDLVLQEYIENPLLLGGKKFDLRVFLLVVPNQRKEVGVYAFVHPGYARLACRNFNLASNDMTLHLTNQAVQYKDKTYKSVKEDTVWSPDTLNQFLNQHRAALNVPCEDWVKRRLYPRVKAILGHVTSVVSSSLCDEPMSYELFGCDFLVDQDFNVWLLEVNSDPSLNKSTKVLSRIITQVVEEAVGLAVEVIQRAVRGMPIKSLVMQQDFKKVYSHANESVLRCALAENRIVYPQFLAR